MASESTSKVTLDGIPNNVSGDGKSFVARLKQFLRGYSKNVDELIENADNNANVSQVANLELTEQHANGKNNIWVHFATTNVVNYSFAQVWVRTSRDGAWVQNGITSGTQYIIENVNRGSTYYVKVVACSKDNGFSNFERAPEAEIEIKGSVTICNTPTQFYWDNAIKRWVWDGYIDNGYTDFFELRTDMNPGVWDANRLDGTTNKYSSVQPPARSGTAYLYVRNVFGEYNAPIAHIYSVSGLNKPTNPIVKATVDGVVIELQALPSGAYEYVVNVDGNEFEINNSQWTYYKFSGSVSVKYCFVDSIGRSEWSNTVTLDVGRKINGTEITDNSISTNQIAANAITAEKINANAVTAGKIAANAVKADNIDAGAVTAGKIAANAIVIGGNNDNGKVVINDNGISGSKIQANTMLGDRIVANTLSASALKTENIELAGELSLTGGPVKLNENGLTSKLDTGSEIRFNQNGMSFIDSSGKVFSQLARFASGTCRHNEYINLGWDTTPNIVLLFPYSVLTMVQGYTNTDLSIKAYPSQISANGFLANVFTAIGSDTYNDCTYTSIPSVNMDRRSDFNHPVDSGARLNYYTAWSTIGNILEGETEVEFKGSLAIDAHQPGRDFIITYNVYFEVQQSLNGTTWETILNKKIGSDHYMWVYDINTQYIANSIISFANKASVRFRFRFELVYLYDFDLHDQRFVISAVGISIKARVTDDYVLREGTAHYLALG